MAIFLATAVVTAWAGFRWGSPRSRALERVAPETATASALPSSLIWMELLERIGTHVPASPKDLPRLKRRLMRAGYRNPNAYRILYGARGCLAVLLALAGLLAGLWMGSANVAAYAAGGGLLGFVAPMQYILFRLRRRKRAVQRGLPNALDLMVVCVEAGLGLDQTILQVAKELQGSYPVICEEFALMNLEMRAGKRRVEALHDLAERTGVPDLKKLVAVLVQTDRFGTSIAACLRGHADYMRIMARQRAEELAAKLAVKLVFPIFFCVLPSLFVVTLGPVMTRMVREVLPMMRNP